MGIFINPGNNGFCEIVSQRYVDKTGLIGLVNEVIGTPSKLVCVTRPRRFGKSYAAQSLVAYYCFGCDSHDLFDGRAISSEPSYKRHLNAYNVVWIDVSRFVILHGADVVEAITSALVEDLNAEFPFLDDERDLERAFLSASHKTGRRFMFVIDEWDAPMREYTPDAIKKRYVDFLRLLFKNGNFTTAAVAGAYMTGILPIKHYGTQSALNDFREYTMIDPGRYAPYVGFTETEVEALCTEYGMGLAKMRRWYDGYELPWAGRVYAPYSTMEALQRGRVGSYWSSSEAFEALRFYIDMDFEGLQSDIVRVVGGDEVRVDPKRFDNDLHDVRSRDAALTLLVHLGYLAYNFESRQARVPNEEVRLELRGALEESHHKEVARIVRESEQLLQDLLAQNEEVVAAGIAHAHDISCPSLYYNNEQALRAVVKAALIAATDEYACVEELPSGRGFADVVYIPKHGSRLPALVVELKWDKPVHTALDQIRERNYPAVLRDLRVPTLLVCVTYNHKTREHHCQIEEL